MFSRLAVRSGGLVPHLRVEASSKKLLVILPVRGSAVMKQIETWDKTNAIYYGPERDTKNFPTEKQPMGPPPTRHGFVPESWFQSLYAKTGVTGPYMLGAGVLTYLISKEIWVIEHGFTEFVSFWIAMYIFIKKLGPGVKKYIDTQHETWLRTRWYAPLERNETAAKNEIADLEKVIWREDGQKYLFESKKENVDLQLEAAYRHRLNTAFQAVKKRLDYQVSMENTKKRFEQNHMVNWIVNGVVQGITPQQEKDSLSKCIQDLKSLSQKHAGTL